MQLLVFAALLGTLFPPVIAVVQREKWPAELRAAVTVILCAAAAFGTVVGKGDWHGWHWPTLDLVWTVFIGLLLGTYGSLTKFWQQINGGRFLTAIEHWTTWSTLRAWWKANHATIEATLSPEQLALARQIIAQEQAAAEQARVAAAIAPEAAPVP